MPDNNRPSGRQRNVTGTGRLKNTVKDWVPALWVPVPAAILPRIPAADPALKEVPPEVHRPEALTQSASQCFPCSAALLLLPEEALKRKNLHY